LNVIQCEFVVVIVVRNQLWRIVPLYSVLCVQLHYAEILVGQEYLPLK
jgi:hypothetical protein